MAQGNSTQYSEALLWGKGLKQNEYITESLCCIQTNTAL